MRVLLLLLLASTWALAAPGGWDKPHRGEGPAGECVTNGHWTLKVGPVAYANDLAEYEKLDWKPFEAGKREAHMKFLKESVFGKHLRVCLVPVEAKNLSGEPRDFGVTSPNWRLRCDDGQTFAPSTFNQLVAMRHLKSGMPKDAPLGGGKTGKGTLVFFIPDYDQAGALFFESLRHSHDGETQSLVVNIGKVKSPKGQGQQNATVFATPAKGKPGSAQKPLEAKGPAGSWVSNGHWQMRVSKLADVTTMEEYEKLPWTKRLTSEDGQKHFAYMRKYVFQDGKKRQHVILVTLEAKNLTSDKLHFGVSQPNWRLTASDGKERGSGLHNQVVASWALEGGIPRDTLVNAGAGSGGTLVFFLPVGVTPESLHFTALRHSKHGETASLQLLLK
ncbi:MAG: hypothetical protein AB7S38_01020 [Vulcanimicrobiota bacterium]